MSRIRAGLIAGLIAVLATSALNIVCRLVGLFPDGLDLKYMAEWLINPASAPIQAFAIGLVIHLIGGVLIGAIFVPLIQRPTPLNGIAFTLIVVWLPLMLVILPLTGRGGFGLNVGLVMPIGALILSIFYGLIVGRIAQRLVVVVANDFTERIGTALTEALQRAIEAEAKGDLHSMDTATERLIIFSDLHKGARNRADDFQRAEQAYNAALAYYFNMGHTLITLGDVEDLWEEPATSVLSHYQYNLKLEAKFHQAGRYLRFWGNHDDDWSQPDLVRRFLDPIYGGAPLNVREALRIRLTEAGQELGTLFMVHGHQGTSGSDRFAIFSKPVVRVFWRSFQILTGISLNTPSNNWQLRDRHNRAMYAWASQQEKLIFVVGHTHRPVFLSHLHVTKIRDELAAAQAALRADPDNAELREQVSLLAAELEWVLAQERQQPGPEGLTPTPKPCHFNTGCCCFSDGDVTGIEIADGEISLVRWPDDDGAPKPKILERAKLSEVFAAL